MKHSLKTMAVLAAVVMSLVAVQAAWAQDTVTVEGTVYSINTAENSIVVDESDNVLTTVYCIPFDFLANKYGIVPAEGDEVTIEAYERTFSDGTTKLLAITYNEITLPGKRGKKK